MKNKTRVLPLALLLGLWPAFFLAQPIPAERLEVEKVEPFVRPDIPLTRLAWRPIEWGATGVVRHLDDFVYLVVREEVWYFKSGQEQLLWQGRTSRAPYLKWSPTGEKIAFVGYMNDMRGIVVQDLGSSQNYLIRPEEDALVGAAWGWSPDGNQIAFTVRRRVTDAKYPGGKRDVYEVFLSTYDASHVEYLTAGAFEDWSPADSILLVSRGEEVASETSSLGFVVKQYLWVINMARRSERKLPLPPASARVFSPTGLKFAFKFPGSHELNVFDLERDVYVSVRLDFENAEPTWSPDGSKLAFTGFETRPEVGMPHEQKLVNSDIWVVNADGSGLSQLTHTGEGTFERFPRWIDPRTLVIAQRIRWGEWNTVVLRLRERR
jgi:Tol biopolymer transport system component